jgi:N-acetylmuramoyl-L-alanine amidase
MAEYNVPVENVIRHYDVTHKVCPAPWVHNEAAWLSFKARLAGEATMPKPVAQIPPTVKFGSRGEHIRALQKLLNKQGFDSGIVDGVFGNTTLAAVKTFQSVKGLVVDGIVGPATWKVLLA